jgi:hypothetical protein
MKVRLLHEQDGQGIMIVETPPQRRTLNVSRRHGWQNVALPYLYHVISYTCVGGTYVYNGFFSGGLMAFIANERIENLRDKVCPAPTDISRGGLVCTPHKFDGKHFKSQKELVQFVLKMWYGLQHDIPSQALQQMKTSTMEAIVDRNWDNILFTPMAGCSKSLEASLRDHMTRASDNYMGGAGPRLPAKFDKGLPEEKDL